ncbi:MAG: UDP-N-acetylmuramate--L-alanine ligase [Bacteroidota bacterium]
MSIEQIHKVYFVGIGGIGMSALARYFNHLGAEIHGYDKTETELTRKLAAEGMKIHYQDDLRFIPDQIDLVIYTPAIPDDHGELTYFRENEFRLMKRAAVLGWISQNRKTIAIAGTHGKTTTSSILTHVLKTGGVDCTAFLGGIAQNFASNFVFGSDNWVVVEADEYDRSFLHLTPKIAVILSMDADHLDIYGDGGKVVDGFRAFAQQLRPGGQLFVNDQWVDRLNGLEKIQGEQSTYGQQNGSYRVEHIRVENGHFVFDFESPIENIESIAFTLPGQHNAENAGAAIAVAQQLGIKGATIKKALASFKGIKRRFEIIHRNDQHIYIDDYAHHPSELTAAIRAAKTLFPNRKLTGIFQPHLYSRTRDFLDGFAAALDQLDELILMDIYPARELPIEGITSKVIFDKMNNPNKTLTTKSQLMALLSEREIDVLMTLGAGDIDTFVDPIKKMMQNA